MSEHATNSNAAATTTTNQSFRTSNANLPPVSSAHGDNAAPPAAAPASNAAQKPGIDTATLDAKIEKAEAKAKAGAQADKLAAAAVLVERANVYRDAGQPSLYKFALGAKGTHKFQVRILFGEIIQHLGGGDFVFAIKGVE